MTFRMARAGQKFGAALEKRQLAAWLAFALLTLLTIVHAAWVCDDAFITARVVDNCLSLRGLRWNPAERVQAFTHPLWLFAMLIARSLFDDAYWSLLGLSVLTSALCVGALVWTRARSEPFFALLAATLACSKSFVDYSTSGLENPLTHLLAILLWHEMRRKPAPSLAKAAIWVGLALLNRLDLSLLFGPPLLLVLLQDRSGTWPERVRSLLVAFAPLLAWEAFSLVYYGSLVPNTATSKLGTALPRAQLLEHGMAYLLQPTWNDPLSLLLLCTGLPLGLVRGTGRLRAFCMGALLYIGYVLWIGGDFMAGRFLSTPVLVSVLSLLELLPVPHLALQAVLAVLVVALQFASARPLWATVPAASQSTEPPGFRSTCFDGVCDEYAFYAPFTHWRRVLHAKVHPPHPWALLGAEWSGSPEHTRVSGAIGFRGFFAGPKVFLVDYYGLSDPLIARLPYEPSLRKWHPGHFKRCVPVGYPEAARLGPEALPDRRLRAYFARIWLVTRGELWTTERWRAIWQLNTREARFTGTYECRVPSAAVP